MAICILSKIDGSDPTCLDAAPACYDDGPAERRASSHATLEGRVWQDFGALDVDRQIKLRTDWMTGDTLDDFLAKFAEVAQIWKWVDHKGRGYRVFFRALHPERIRGHNAYRVEMLLDVIEVVN
jgi:hypothetical protein